MISAGDLLAELEGFSSVLFVADENTRIYAEELLVKLRVPSSLEILGAGESMKSLGVLEPFLEKAVSCLDRKSAIVAVGGGVVLDFAGFASSILYRGIACYLVPTSLLAMVDAGIGGKTALNLKAGKNLVGSFIRPRGMVLNFDALQTLPEKELVSGLGELLKTSILDSQSFFERVAEMIRSGQWRNLELYPELIRSAIEVKTAVVEADYHEDGKRAILNLGHSLGHALEALHYYQISHGQAILAGLMLEAKIGRCLDLVDPEFEAELSSLIQELPVPEIPQNLDSLLPFLDRDKKSRDSRLGFVFYRRPGVAAIPKTWVRYLSPAEFRGLVREAF